MSEKCPKCDRDFIRLYSVIRSTSVSAVGTEWDDVVEEYVPYGYWCKYCQEMYSMKVKTWFEPWRFEDGAN